MQRGASVPDRTPDKRNSRPREDPSVDRHSHRSVRCARWRSLDDDRPSGRDEVERAHGLEFRSREVEVDREVARRLLDFEEQQVSVHRRDRSVGVGDGDGFAGRKVVWPDAGAVQLAALPGGPTDGPFRPVHRES